MADIVEQLIIKIGADVADLKKGIAETNRELGGMNKQAKDATAGMTASFSSIQAAAVRMAAVVGVSLGVQGFVGSINDSIKSMVDLGRQSKSFGIATNELAKLKFAAEATGVGFEQLTLMFSKLAEGTRAGNLNQTTAALMDLGIALRSATTGQARALPDLLKDILVAFQKIPEGAKQGQFAIQLFGEQGLKLLPFLLKGPEGIKKLGEELEKLGGAPSKEAIKSADELNETLLKLTASKDAILKKITVGLIPALKTLAGELEKASKQGSLWESVLSLLQSVGVADIGGGTSYSERLARKMGWTPDQIAANQKFQAQQAAAVRAAEELTGGMGGASPAQLAALTANSAAQKDLNTRWAEGTDVLQRLNELKSMGKSLYEQTLTPLEQLSKLEKDLAEIRATGLQPLFTEEVAQRALLAARLEYINQQEALAESLGANFTLHEKEEQSLRKIEEAYRSGKITAEQYGRAQLTVAQQTQQAYASAASALGSAAATIFNKNKAISVASAIISTYEAANKAMVAFPGPPTSFAYVAAALATGFANVRSILSTTKDGGGPTSAGAGAGAAAAAAPAAEASSRSITINPIDPAGLFSGAQVSTMIDALNEETKRGKTLIATTLRPT